MSPPLALVAPMSSVFAQATTAPGRIDNWRNVDGNVWKNGTRELCWRDNFWTPATAMRRLRRRAEARRAPTSAPPPPPRRLPRSPRRPRRPPPSSPRFRRARRSPTPPTRSSTSTSPSLKPEAKTKLDDLVSKTKDINLEVIIAVGHTDSVGTDAYNQKLSVRRAEADQDLPDVQGRRKPTASTPKARARSSRSPTTRPPKAARRTAAWKSKWSARAPPASKRDRSRSPTASRASRKDPLRRVFSFRRRGFAGGRAHTR